MAEQGSDPAHGVLLPVFPRIKVLRPDACLDAPSRRHHRRGHVYFRKKSMGSCLRLGGGGEGLFRAAIRLEQAA